MTKETVKAISSSAASQKDNPNNLPNIKKYLVNKQLGKCPITGRDLRSMTDVNVVVDHSHQTGYIRAALPRAINALEGKLRNLLIRWGGCKSETEIIQMLRGFADYLDLHRVPQTHWSHPTHLSPAEARAKRNALARKRYAAKKKESK